MMQMAFVSGLARAIAKSGSVSPKWNIEKEKENTEKMIVKNSYIAV